MTNRRDTELTTVEEQRALAPIPGASRRMEVQLAREMEKMQAIAEIGMEAMSQMSEVERYAAYKAATTGAAANFLMQAALQRGLSPAEEAAQQERFENYLRRMGQVAEATNIKLIMEFDEATGTFCKRTLADGVEDLGARMADILQGRRSLPSGRR